MSNLQIKVSGFGGQGVILLGTIIGKAAAVYDNKHVTMTRSYGPEARGGACSAQVIIGNQPIDYPYVTCPEVLIVFSQEAYKKNVRDIAEGGILFYEKDLTAVKKISPIIRTHAIPSIRIAERLGNRVAMNMVMLGFFAKTNHAVSLESLRKAIQTTVPPKLININLAAFEEGYAYQPKAEEFQNLQ